jgi:hypothetical protein
MLVLLAGSAALAGARRYPRKEFSLAVILSQSQEEPREIAAVDPALECGIKTAGPNGIC